MSYNIIPTQSPFITSGITQPQADLKPAKTVTPHCLKSIVTPEVAPRWKFLADKLGFKHAQRKTIEANHPGDIEEACNDMLRRWIDKSPADATSDALCRALTNTGFTGLSERINKELQSDPDYLSKNPDSPADISEMNRPQLEEQNAQLKDQLKALNTDSKTQIDRLASLLQTMKRRETEQEQKLRQIEKQMQEMSITIRELKDENERQKTEIDALNFQLATQSPSSPLTSAVTDKPEPEASDDAFTQLYKQETIGTQKAAFPSLLETCQKIPVTYWDAIAIHLGLESYLIENINHDSRDSGDKIYRIIGAWIQTCTSFTDYREFSFAVYTALKKAGKKQDAIKFGREIIQKPTNAPK